MKNKLISITIIAVLLLSLCVTAYAAPTTTTFSKSIGVNTTLDFTAAFFTDNYSDTEPIALESIRFTALPEAANGALKLNDTDITANQAITIENMDEIKFIPAADFEGTVTIPWQGYNGTTYSNTSNIEIVVGTPSASPTPSPSPIASSTPSPTPSPTPSASPTPSPSPSPTPTPDFPYIDMDGHWADPAAVDLALGNILRGEQIGGNFYFEPRKLLTRGDFVLLLNAAMGISAETPTNEEFIFADEATLPAWLTRQGKLAYEAGIIKGVDQGGIINFNPRAPLTRIEAFTMLNNILEEINPADLAPITFSDKNSIPLWGITPVQKLIKLEIIRGYPDNTIRPDDPVYRESAAQLVSQTLQALPDTESLQTLMSLKIEEE